MTETNFTFYVRLDHPLGSLSSSVGGVWKGHKKEQP